MEANAIRLLFAGTISAFENFVAKLSFINDIELDTVDSSRAAVHALVSAPGYSAIILDPDTPDLDVWRLIAIVRSGRFCGHDIPIVIIDDTCDKNVPALLCRDRGVSLVPWDQVAQIPERIENNRKDTKPTLLIIEDDPRAADMAMHALKPTYRVSVAATGSEGLELWQTLRPNVVVLDLRLPDIPGERVLEQIISRDPYQAVVIMTAYAQLENHENLMLNGASEFIGKPFRVDQLNKACRIAHNQSLCLRTHHRNQDRLNQLSKCLWAANYYLESGKTGQAKREINEILDDLPAPSDDDRVKIANGWR